METEFANKKLEKLFEAGSHPKYKIEPQVLESFIEVVIILDAAKDIYDLWQLPSLKFKKYKKGYSLRVSGKWRLEIDIDWENKEKTTGTIQIKELSNHYGD